jgi:hypothetical protein
VHHYTIYPNSEITSKGKNRIVSALHEITGGRGVHEIKRLHFLPSLFFSLAPSIAPFSPQYLRKGATNVLPVLPHTHRATKRAIHSYLAHLGC